MTTITATTDPALFPLRRFAGWPALAGVASVYVALCFLALPYYWQIIDPDDTAYLKIAERWAEGDWKHAINGMWSPLNSWLAAPFMRAGADPLYIFKYLNIAFGCVALACIYGLLRKSPLPPRWRLPALVGLLPFAVYATYHELAADWLQCALLLLYANLIFSGRYKARPHYAFWCGALGALAYYAKYYNFHFFWLHFTVANFFIFYDFEKKKLDRKFRRVLALGIGTLILLALPWVIALHGKYGFWKLNYTGAIDISWSLDYGSLIGNHTLLRPTQPGAASYWEDPWWIQEQYLTPFSSFKMLARQAMISAGAVSSLMAALYFFSALAVAVWAWVLLRVLGGGYKKPDFFLHSLMLTACMCSGYMLFHVEPRFVWPVGILSYILTLHLLYAKAWPLLKKRWMRLTVAGLTVLTFCVKPAEELYKYIERDDSALRIARALEPLHLQGGFITNSDQNKWMRIAYLTGTGMFVYDYWGVKEEKLVEALQQEHVNYYIETTDGRLLLPAVITSQLAEISGGKVPGVKVYRLE